MTLAIRVLSRMAAEKTLALPGEVCVSITNPRQSPAVLPGWAAVLRFGFHDAAQPGGNFILMTYAQAKELLAFCRNNQQAPVMVHCQFGASRSVAIGLFIATWFRRPLNLTEVDVLVPNMWVVNQLRAAALMAALSWRDWRLLMVAVRGPLSFRREVLPPAVADTYLD